MISEKRTKRQDINSFKMMAEDNNKNEYMPSDYKVSKNDLDQITYNYLIDAFSSGDAQGVETHLNYLKQNHREDLINNFENFKATIELQKKQEEEKVFLDNIKKIIDVSKLNPEIIPYLINVEKRLSSIELHLNKN